MRLALLARSRTVCSSASRWARRESMVVQSLFQWLGIEDIDAGVCCALHCSALTFSRTSSRRVNSSGETSVRLSNRLDTSAFAAMSLTHFSNLTENSVAARPEPYEKRSARLPCRSGAQLFTNDRSPA